MESAFREAYKDGSGREWLELAKIVELHHEFTRKLRQITQKYTGRQGRINKEETFQHKYLVETAIPGCEHGNMISEKDQKIVMEFNGPKECTPDELKKFQDWKSAKMNTYWQR